MPDGEDVCADCRASPLDISLVLTCNHRLCLSCASRHIRCPPGGEPITPCPSCGAVTEVDRGAAEQIREHCSSAAPAAGSSSGADESEPKAPSSWQRLPPPSTEKELCGQCETLPALLKCWQCDEVFCQSCSSSMHRAGRMREHRLSPIGGQSSFSGPVAPTLAASVGEPLETTRASMCKIHPNEPVHFFCLDCHSECICAECAVEKNARHHGHDVVNARAAYQRLSASMAELLDSSANRAHDRTQAQRQAGVLKQELDAIINDGKARIRDAFKSIKAGLAEKEDELLAGAQGCGQSAEKQLLSRAFQFEDQAAEGVRRSTALEELQNAPWGEEVKALNAFHAAKASLETAMQVHGKKKTAAPAASSREASPAEDAAELEEFMRSLKGDIAEACRVQAAQVRQLASCVPDIRRQAGGKAPPPSATW
eukprot:TRINITY_DN107128_c0_g1_i1.p1 TRINITY_DN107128_c0_g1~~TRINITY_DN107128_c0_g1_i1.p1  ORF type:complete len:426 (+),score=92.09 TRINITY_DN107128_c0_g1_i1:19-1296(+)